MGDREGGASGLYPGLNSSFVMIQTAHHARGKHVRLVLRVCPKYVVTDLVINHVNPTSLGVVLPAPFPILWMDQINLAVLVGLTGGLAPIDILKPLYFGILEVIKPAQSGDRFLEIRCLVVLKECRQ